MSKPLSWEKKFYDRTFLWMYRARDARSRVIIPTNLSGKFQLEVRDFETGFRRQLTKASQGSIFGSISPSGKFVFYLDDKDGNETGHFVRVPFEGGKKIDITPNLPPYFSFEVSLNDLDDRLCFYASIGEKNKVYLILFDEKGGPLKPKLLYKTKNSILGSTISPDGLYTCVSVMVGGKKDVSEILVFNNNNSKIICRTRVIGDSFVAQAFSSVSEKSLILGVSNMSGFYRPVWFDFIKKEIEEIKNKNFKGNIFVMEWFENEKQLLLGQEFRAKHELFVYDLGKKQVQPIGPTYGSFDFFFGSVASLANGSLLLRWQSLNDSPKFIKLMAPNYRQITKIYSPTIKNKEKIKFENIDFKSLDGTPVQMWVAKPSDKKKAHPFIIDIHGGPHGAVGDSFSLEAQIWLEQGFGYCAVNYRGSTGFGRDFEKAIYGDPGTLEVEDIVAARNRLIKKGWADPQKIILVGWSWGGYVTLLTLGKYPNLWAGGIAGTPIADFFLQYEDEPAFFQALDREMFGGALTQKPQVYKKSSPITYADNFAKPLLVIYGENDARCPSRQIVNFIKTLKAKGKIIKVKKFSSGHVGGFSNPKIKVSNFREILNFANKLINKNSLKR